MLSNLWPPLEASAPADPDLSGEHADWGTVNREALAQKLAEVYWGESPLDMDANRTVWLAVADTAVSEVLGVAP